MPQPALIECSFIFHPADLTALGNRLSELDAAGVSVRRGQLLRALVHVTPEEEMIIRVRQLLELSSSDETVAGRPGFDLFEEHVCKLDRVKSRLLKLGLQAGAARSVIVRALVRFAPAGAALAPQVRNFLQEFPARPRGLSKLRLEAAAKKKRRD